MTIQKKRFPVKWNRDSSVSLVARLRGGQTKNRDSVLFTVQETFVVCRAFILALRTTQIPIQCVSEALSPG
jgi:hypothetical protein